MKVPIYRELPTAGSSDDLWRKHPNPDQEASKPNDASEINTEARNTLDRESGFITLAQRTNAAPSMIVSTLIETNNGGSRTCFSLETSIQFRKTTCGPDVVKGGTNAAAITAPANAEVR